MNLSALGILLVAACMHAGWNLLLKRAGGSYASLWWALVLSSLVCLPVLFIYAPLPARVWPYVIATSLVEAAYYGTLASAYQQEDFSLVYPIARGAAPALLAVWSILFLKETPSLAGKIGLGSFDVGTDGYRLEQMVGDAKGWGAQPERPGPGRPSRGDYFHLLRD